VRESVTKKRERLAEIVRLLQVRGAASIAELAAQLGVSEMTVRRDLAFLAEGRVVRLVHAGAMLGPEGQGGVPARYSLAEAGSQKVEQKLRMGKMAASLLEDGEIVIIDSGTTTECLARCLPQQIHLTVVCFALNILIEIRRRENCRILFAGGQLHENSLVFESPEGVELVSRYRATTCFISASGISEALGVTCSNQYEVSLKRAAIASSRRRLLLADSSKFGRIQAAYFADLREFEAVVTDRDLPDEHRQAVEQLGVGVHLA
jgi:DeoR family deoxyribose operon repressor